jgi:KAP family P-loop domain
MRIRPPELEISSDDPFENDCLGRRELEEPLTQFVTQAIGPFVLAIDGSWGSGKTTFLKMWEVKLKETGHLCLYLNAWKTDFVQDPLVAVVGELSIAVKEHSLNLLDKNNVDEKIEKIEKTARSIVKRLIPTVVKLGTAGVISESTTEKIMADLKGETAQDYSEGKLDIKEFRENLSSLATMIQQSNENPIKIVIIIDELDRCRPTYAVQLLERIKHLFDVEGVVFVLGIDREQLSHSIKALYGSEFEAKGYLKRFIDLDYRLPEPELGCYCSSLFEKFEIKQLISKRPVAYDGSNQNELNDLEYYLGYFMSAAGMGLRDQEQIVSKLRVVLQTVPATEYLYPITLTILLFLRNYKDSEIHSSFMSGNLTAKDFMTFIESLPNEREAFEILSNKAKYISYLGLFKERIEGVFLSGLRQILKEASPEEKEYVKAFNSPQNPDDSIKWIITAISQEKGSLNATMRRLNLTSNFVQN